MNDELKKRILSSIFIIPVVFFFSIKGSYLFILLLAIIFLISVYEWHFLAKKKPYYIFGFIFAIFSFYSIYQIRIIQYDTYHNFLFILLICIFTDIGGYIFGKTFKGPKLTQLSPNKTISGLIGSYIFALGLIPFLILFKIINQEYILMKIIFVLIISSVSQIGDITISYFKRKSNVKDTGKIIPGHGGILDRVDGMIFAYPLAYLIMFNNILNLTK